MGRRHLNQRVYLARRLLRSFAVPEVRAQLEPVGLDQAEIARGDALLSDAQDRTTSFQSRILRTAEASEVVDWKRRRFPIVSAVLDEIDPNLGRVLFAGIDTSSEARIGYSVELVAARLLALSKSAAAADVATWQALVRHGITADELTAIEAKASTSAPFAVKSDAKPGVVPEDRETALAALAAYRKKWARIARTTISDRRLLRAMGAVESRAALTEEAAPDAASPAAASPVTAGAPAAPVATTPTGKAHD